MAFSYRVLGQAAPPAGEFHALYTVPPSTQTVASSLTICNRGGSIGKYRIYVGSISSGPWKVASYLNFGIFSGTLDMTDGAGKSWTKVGNPTSDTNNPLKWGAKACMLFDGGYMTTPAHEDFNFRGNDFTIEFWVQPESDYNDYRPVMGQMSAYQTDRSFEFFRAPNGGGMYFEVSGVGGTGNISVLNTQSLAANSTFRHIAAVRRGSNLTLFIDGIGSSVSINENIHASSSTVKIGYTYNTGLAPKIYLDDVRITKGIARYTGNFTPPTVAGTVDGITYPDSGFLVYDSEVLGNEMVQMKLGISLEAGRTLFALSDNGNVSFSLLGSEIT
jgi:hypothetical protein